MVFQAFSLTRRRRIALLGILTLFFLVTIRLLYSSNNTGSGGEIVAMKYANDPKMKYNDKRKLEGRSLIAKITRGDSDKEKNIDLYNDMEDEDKVEFDETKDENLKEEGAEPVATPGVNMADNSQDGFDAEKVFKLFCTCRGDGDIIFIDCYVDAYEELCKLFRLFGTIFSFVTSDVEEKIAILREYRKSDKGEQYKTVQSMIEYEVANDLTKSKKKDSGSRTLLRLHRALEFISAFLLKLKNSNNEVKFSSESTKAYDDTLAKHHPWLIKKAVHVAMYMLPTRPDLLRKMRVEDDAKGMKGIEDLVTELNVIFQVTEAVYAKENLLDLP